LAQLPNLPLVIIRFCLRMIILVVFAAFGSFGFGRSLVALLCMSTILSAIVGMIRREPAFDAVLNHWDEASSRIGVAQAE
jgi:hypothetical protein